MRERRGRDVVVAACRGKISKWRTGEMKKGDRELVRVCLPGLGLGKSDGKKIRRRGKVNRESMTE